MSNHVAGFIKDKIFRMTKRVFIVHGWSGSPEEGWFPWLKSELEQRGFVVSVPPMPDTDDPKIEPWTEALNAQVGTPNEQTYFVGHSIGCQTILRYIESLPADAKIGGVVCVAGWFTLMNLETDDTPINTEQIKQHVKNIVAIFSDNDDVVPEENIRLFQENLGAQTVLEHGKGHFSGSDGLTELPVALQSVLEIAD